MAEDDKKNPNEDPNQPPTEEQLATEKRDPDEAVFAEQAIREYAGWVIDTFLQNVEQATSDFAAWVSSQTEQATFNDAGFFDQAQKAFSDQILSMCGGADSPVGQVMASQLNDTISMAIRDESEASFFIDQMWRAARDGAWYLRDNVQAILSNQWDSLLDLAYEGSTEFIPVIHQFGLPPADWNPSDLSGNLIATGEAYAATVPKKQEEAMEEAPKEEGSSEEGEEKEAEAEEAQEEFQEEKEVA